jgi:RNA polymerase sigma-70 factor (ECF subfamily)
VREHEPAMDLAQEVLVSAYRALSTFQGRSRFSSWLFAITRNRCLNAVAAKRLLRDDTELDELPGPAPAPEAELELEQDEERVRQLVMKHLDEDEQRALWLSCFERLPVEEITRIMQLESASGARGLLQRARRRLRSALDRRDLVEEP